jgi:hypothetical protein
MAHLAESGPSATAAVEATRSPSPRLTSWSPIDDGSASRAWDSSGTAAVDGGAGASGRQAAGIMRTHAI